MEPAAILANCGPFLWPLLVVSLAVWYQPAYFLCGGPRPDRRRLEQLGAIASSVGLMGSAYGLANALAAGAQPDQIGSELAVAVCSTVVGTLIAIMSGAFVFFFSSAPAKIDENS